MRKAPRDLPEGVYRHGDGYQVCVSHGFGNDGKRLRDYYTFAAIAEAVKARRRLLHLRDEGKLVERSNATLAQYIQNYLDNHAHVAPKTLERYRGILRLQIAPHIGGIKLRNFKLSHLKDFYATLAEPRADGDKHKPGLSGATIRQVHALVHLVLAYAVEDEVLATNVAAKVKNKPKAQSAKVRPPDGDALNRLLDSLRGTNLYTLVLLAAHTGLRRGELLGLRWADVSLNEQLLNVRQSLYELDDGTLGFKSPKSGEPRTVTLDASICAALEAHRREQARTGINALVFPAPEDRAVRAKDGGVKVVRAGERWQPSALSGQFKRAAKRAGLSMHFHELRHAMASLLLRKGAPMKLISDRLGHSTTAITDKIYAHLSDDHRRAAADMMGEALGRRSS